MIPNRLKAVACLFTATCFLAACSKSEDPAAAAAADPSAEAPVEEAAAPPPVTEPVPVESLPGENAVRSALASKDYQRAVSQLVAMKNGLPSEMWSTYSRFYGEVRDTLIVEAKTDAKAAQALAGLSAMTSGR